MNETIMKFRDEITAKLIAAIEAGTAPWQCCWNGREAPQNAVSHRLYKGINQLALTVEGLAIDGGKDPRWLTYKQAKDNGWHVKKGSTGTHVTLWKPIVLEESEDEIIGVMQKVFTVFHASQIEGIDEYKPAELTEIESNEKAEQIIQNSGARINYGGGRACYIPAGDFIQLPIKGDFKSTESYYSTALHELVHWTKHNSRLNRNYDYAFEELIAEIGSMFVCSEAGIKQSEGEFQNHASYVDGWLSCLKKDSNAIFKAAAQASKAADFLISRGGK